MGEHGVPMDNRRPTMIETREEYEYCLKRGYDPLIDERFPMEIGLRREIQREKFGKNNAEGNRKFYRFCIEHSGNFCEECGRYIPFPSAVNISHRLSRGAHPAISHDPRNFDFLCYSCHKTYENGDRKGMKIYPRVEKMIEKLKEEYYNV